MRILAYYVDRICIGYIRIRLFDILHRYNIKLKNEIRSHQDYLSATQILIIKFWLLISYLYHIISICNLMINYT